MALNNILSFNTTLGEDGKLTCRRCKKSFSRERVFNAHRCSALSEYVDFTTKDVSNVDPGKCFVFFVSICRESSPFCVASYLLQASHVKSLLCLF